MLTLFLKLLGNWRLTAIIMAVSVVVSGYAGWKVRDLFADHAELAQLKADNKAKDADIAKKQAAATEYEKKIAQLRENNGKLNTLLDNELKNPAYKCIVPDNGVRLLNQAVIQSNTTGLDSGGGKNAAAGYSEISEADIIKHESTCLRILGECRQKHLSLVKACQK